MSDNSAETLAEILKYNKAERTVVLVDRNVFCIRKIQQIIRYLEKLGLEARVVEVDAHEPDTDLVDEYTKVFKTEPLDFLVGIGGGSTLDLAKAVSVLAFNPGCAADYQGRDLLPSSGCPSVMMPTTAGTGSEVTPGAVVLDPKTKRKGAISSPYITPDYAVLDPELTLSMPPEVAAATGLDALGHAVESFTAQCATPMTKMYSKEAFRLITSSLTAILQEKDSLDRRRGQQLGATLAGVAICNSDTGACHAMAYPLGIYFQIPHGVAVALLLAHVIDVNVRKGARQYAELADLLPEDSEGLSEEEKCWKFQRFVADLVPSGVLPSSLRHYGVESSDLPELAERGLDLKTALSNNPVDFTKDDAQYVLEQLM